MKKITLIIALMAVMFGGQAHSVSKFSHTRYIFQQGDTTNYRQKAYNILRRLKTGSVIVRLKTDQKSVDAYKRDGEEKIAQRIIEQRKAQNQRIYDAFKGYFTFCKVYFIYAEDTRKFLQGKHVFLNSNLAYDNSITMRDTNFIFCEYGSAEAYSKYTDISGFAVDEPSVAGYKYTVEETSGMKDSSIRETSTDPASTSCLFFLDKRGNQLFTPFPGPQAINTNNYEGAVSRLNEEMDRAYFNLVLNKKKPQ